MNPWYKISNIDQIDSPALVFYEDRISNNIKRMLQVAGHPEKLRPHIKTHKTAEIIKLQQGLGINKFKCATIAEAELLGEQEAHDVLIAFQPTGPKIDRLFQLQKKFSKTRFSTIIDNSFSARELGQYFHENKSSIDVYIDLNIGMHRTGIVPGAQALKLYRELVVQKGVKVIGFHVYDGHIHNSDLQQRKVQCDTAFEPVEKLLNNLKEAENSLKIVVGGTPSFPIHAKRPDVEVSPGTCVLWDNRYHSILPDQEFSFGAVLITRVVSVLSGNRLCLDLGHKSVAAENPFPRVMFLNLPGAEEVMQSEEHLVITVQKDTDVQIGTVIYAVPMHICPTCALYEKAHIVRDGTIDETWEIKARKRKLSI